LHNAHIVPCNVSLPHSKHLIAFILGIAYQIKILLR
jgi:hypothetical protein